MGVMVSIPRSLQSPSARRVWVEIIFGTNPGWCYPVTLREEGVG